jgi:hypothetical protein
MTTEKEPTFRLEIRACSFHKLSMEDLVTKLQLMHKLNFKTFYTIIEDTDNAVMKDGTVIAEKKLP